MKSLPYIKLHIKGTSIPALGIACATKTPGKQTNLYCAQTSNEVIRCTSVYDHVTVHRNKFLYNKTKGEFRPRQTRQLPRAVDLKGRLLSCQSY